MEYKDYYKILGVEKNASDKEIKSAYRRLARKYHPDVNKDKGATDRFKEINEANAVLGDPEKRSKYDQLGSNWQQYERMGNAGANPFSGAGRRVVYTWGTPGGAGGASAAGAGGFDFSDFFQMFFGGDAGNPFGQAYEGMGRGTQGFTGAGMRAEPEQEAEIEVTLEEIAEGSERRVNLSGQEVTVKIPRGIRQGVKLRIPAERGHAGADVYLKVKYRDHPVFRVDGEDIVTEVSVPVTRAVLGGEISVPTLSGSVNMKIPAGTQGGRTMRLRGQGLPRWRSDGKGDQLVKIRIVIPEQPTEKELNLYRELDQLRA